MYNSLTSGKMQGIQQVSGPALAKDSYLSSAGADESELWEAWGIPGDKYLIVYGDELCVATGDGGNGKKQEASPTEEF